MERPLTGRKVLAIALGAFGIIIAANMTMLYSALGSFPGLVVKNSYVASQKWNDRLAAQQALGWQAEIAHQDDMLTIALTDRDGNAVTDPDLEVTVGRPTTDVQDRLLRLAADGQGYRTPLKLGPGQWLIEARTTDGPAYRIQTVVLVN
ncbi:MAG: FixH family protein [Pseudomonadota bacterium]